jgi:hypothetical protein
MLAIPIPIIRRSVRKGFDFPGRCAACGAEQGFAVEADLQSVWVAFFPVFGASANAAGRCKACGYPAPAEIVARAKPALVVRGGCLFFFVIPGILFGGYSWIDSHLTKKAYAERQEREDRERRDAEAAKKERRDAEVGCEAAYKKAQEAERACLKAVNETRTAILKDLDLERERAPKDASSVKDTPTLVIGDPVTDGNPLFGSSPCDLQVDDAYQYGGAYVPGYYQAKPLDDIRTKTAKWTSGAASLQPPARWVTVKFACNDYTCTSTAAWFDKPSKSVLALARVSKAKSGDEAADKKALAEMLAKKTAAWK